MIGLAFDMWAADHDGTAFPFTVPRSKGGTLELSSPDTDGFERNATPHFLALSESGLTAKTLACPGDPAKVAAGSFQIIAASNVTYQIRSGPAITPSNTNEVLVRCPIHGNLLFCGGAVKLGE
jgi:hypothetical protein